MLYYLSKNLLLLLLLEFRASATLSGDRSGTPPFIVTSKPCESERTYSRNLSKHRKPLTATLKSPGGKWRYLADPMTNLHDETKSSGGRWPFWEVIRCALPISSGHSYPSLRVYLRWQQTFCESSSTESPFYPWLQSKEQTLIVTSDDGNSPTRRARHSDVHCIQSLTTTYPGLK